MRILYILVEKHFSSLLHLHFQVFRRKLLLSSTSSSWFLFFLFSPIRPLHTIQERMKCNAHQFYFTAMWTLFSQMFFLFWLSLMIIMVYVRFFGAVVKVHKHIRWKQQQCLLLHPYRMSTTSNDIKSSNRIEWNVRTTSYKLIMNDSAISEQKYLHRKNQFEFDWTRVWRAWGVHPTPCRAPTRTDFHSNEIK